MTRRNGIVALLFALGVSICPAWGLRPAQVSVNPGISTGFLLADNPGSYYSAPIVTEIATELTMNTPFPLEAGVWLTFAPFLPSDPGFGRSLMTLLEAGMGTRFTLHSLEAGALFVALYGGGGIYSRVTEGDRAAGTARRPTVLLRIGGGMTADRWEYQLTLTSRVLFDQQPVFGVVPAIGVRYRIPIGGAE